MKLSEALSIEEHNNGEIHLFKEGLFWRSYEISSYFFSSHIKAYQLTKKFYKNVGKEVIYLGFPGSVLDDILNKINNKIVRDDKHITIKGYQCNTAHYQEWKASVDLKIGRAASSLANTNTDTLHCITSFDTLNKTPGGNN